VSSFPFRVKYRPKWLSCSSILKSSVVKLCYWSNGHFNGHIYVNLGSAVCLSIFILCLFLKRELATGFLQAGCCPFRETNSIRALKENFEQ